MPILKYNGKNSFTYHVEDVSTESKKTLAVSGLTIRLRPGVNEVSDKELTAMKRHEFFGIHLASGTIQILLDSELEADKKSVNEMLGIINKCYDPKLLNKIIVEDERQEVIEAAKKQLDTFKVAKKQAKQESGE